MQAEPELCCFLWVQYVENWCAKYFFSCPSKLTIQCCLQLKRPCYCCLVSRMGVPGKLQSFLNLLSTSCSCSTVWHPQGRLHAVLSSIESQEILTSFVWGEEKLQWNPSTVILKMETGFVPYLVKLVMQDSCSLIKYKCILLLPWWVWVWVGFFTWTPKMEMPKATPKKLCCYFTVLVPDQNRLGWGCRNVVILIVKPLEFTDSECHWEAVVFLTPPKYCSFILC